MKRSSQVTLTIVAAMGLASCSRKQDPCQASTFNEQACQEAVNNGGYYWHGSWVGMHYSYPYPYYYDAYRGHVSRGGAWHAAPSGSYGHPSGAAGVSRGGFGSIGSGHGIGG